MSDITDTLLASRDHHVQALSKLVIECAEHKLEIGRINKMLQANRPKRVVSEETKSKMSLAHQARWAIRKGVSTPQTTGA